MFPESWGYVKVRENQNGFTAIVQHALPISPDPQCMDPEGTRKFLPRYLKVAELRAQGKTPEEIFQPATLPGTLDSEPCNTEPVTIGFFLCWPSKI